MFTFGNCYVSTSRHFALSRANSNNVTYINFLRRMYFTLNTLKACSARLNASTDQARRFKGANNPSISFNRFQKYRFSDFPHVLFWHSIDRQDNYRCKSWSLRQERHLLGSLAIKTKDNLLSFI